MLSSQRFCTQCGAANRQQAAFCFACGQSLDQSDDNEANISTNSILSTSRLLKDRYRVLSRLGSGGMGAVDKAEDTLFNQRLVAIKEMSQVGLNSQQRLEAAADFKREAYMLANLQHQGLPTIYDYFSDEGQWCLVMDFIEGETLEDYLDENAGWLPIQLCKVLSYLHTRQPPIIFRDLKPANIMITPKEQVVLIDFGIARHFKPGQLKDTASFGSAGYAAPEQYGKTQTTPRSDIYSLGVILHQCLTGNDPSTNSPTPFDFPPLDLHGQFAPPSLNDLIRQMLAMNPANRPEHIGVVLQQLLYTDRQLGSLQAEQETQYITMPRMPRTPGLIAPIVPPVVPPAPSIPYTRTKPTLQDPIPERLSAPIIVPTPKIVVPQPTTSSVKEYHFPSGIIRAMALSPDNTVLALGDDRGQVITWDIAKFKAITTHHPHTYAISSLSWSPQKGIVASTDINNLLIVLNTATGNKAFNIVFRYRTQVSMLLSITWSPNGDKIAFSDSRGIVSIRSAIDGKSISHYSGHTSAVSTLSWSPNGEFIASGDKTGQVQIWQINTLQLQTTYTAQGPISAVAFSPDGETLLATDKTGHAFLWSQATQKLLTTYTGHSPQQITTCAWSPNGEYVATGSSDTTIHVWRADTGVHVITHARHQAAILGIGWLPDGENIISMDLDNNLHLSKVR